MADYRFSASAMRASMLDVALGLGCWLILAEVLTRTSRPPVRDLLRAASGLGLRLCLRNGLLALGLVPIGLALGVPGMPAAGAAAAFLAGPIGIGIWLWLGPWAWLGGSPRWDRRPSGRVAATSGRNIGPIACALGLESAPIVAALLLPAEPPAAWLLLWPVGPVLGRFVPWTGHPAAVAALAAAWLLALTASWAAADGPRRDRVRPRLASARLR
ncbi:MAG: hypothetical protein KDH92_10935 [Chloroflexi bacterium]|nr:hypothetical protein [Chloroflexota bacterium]